MADVLASIFRLLKRPSDVTCEAARAFVTVRAMSYKWEPVQQAAAARGWSEFQVRRQAQVKGWLLRDIDSELHVRIPDPESSGPDSAPPTWRAGEGCPPSR
jgi:hypothetical protein